MQMFGNVFLKKEKGGSGQLSAISDQLSAVSGQLSAPVVGCCEGQRKSF